MATLTLPLSPHGEGFIKFYFNCLCENVNFLSLMLRATEAHQRSVIDHEGFPRMRIEVRVIYKTFYDCPGYDLLFNH
jgi:hypothetical protein